MSKQIEGDVPSPPLPPGDESSLGQELLLVSDSGIDRSVFTDILSRHLPETGLTMAASGTEAAAIAHRSTVDLVLFADHVLRLDGLASVRAVREVLPHGRIAVFGMISDLEAAEWSRAGLDGILSQRLSPERFAQALRFLLAGNRYASPEIFDQSSGHLHFCASQGVCKRLMPLLDELPVPLFLLQYGHVIHANRAALADLNLEASAVLDRSFADLMAPTGRETLAVALSAAERNGGLPPRLLLPLAVGRKRARWIETQWSRIDREGAQILCCICLDQSGRIDAATPEMLGPSGTEAGGDRQDGPVTADPPAAGKANRFEDMPALGNAPGPDRELAVPQNLQRRITRRQRQVLALLGEGSTNKEIAMELDIAEATVKLHVHHILRALGVKNRTEAALLARRFNGD